MSESHQNFEDRIKARIDNIYATVPELLTIKQGLEAYDERIVNGAVKHQGHIDNVRMIQSVFSAFIGAAALVWANKSTSPYVDFNKWKTISTAFHAFADAVNSKDLLDETINTASKTTGISYDQLILNIQAMASKFLLTINVELQNAAEVQIRRMDDLTANPELARKDAKIASLDAEIASLKAVLAEGSSSASLSQQNRQIDRLQREVERLRPFERQPDHQQLNEIAELQAELAQANQRALSQQPEIERLRRALAEANSEREQQAIFYNQTLAKMQNDHRAALGETFSSIQNRIEVQDKESAQVLKELRGELKDASTVIAELRVDAERMRKENEQIKTQLNEGKELYLQEMFVEEKQTRQNQQQQIARLTKDKTKLSVSLANLQTDFDTLAASMNKLLAKAGQRQLSPLAMRTKGPDHPVVSAKAGAVKNRHAQADQSTDLVAAAPTYHKPGRYHLFEQDKQGQYQEVKQSRKDSLKSSTNLSDDDTLSTSSEEEAPRKRR